MVNDDVGAHVSTESPVMENNSPQPKKELPPIVCIVIGILMCFSEVQSSKQLSPIVITLLLFVV